MPQFAPNESKVARVPMRNPKGVAFDYTGFFYMGTDFAIMSQVDFHLEAGEEKIVSFPVTMPSGVGRYPVYIGVFSGELYLALYRATEDVTIASVVPQVVITGATWELKNYPFVGYWPEETGTLYATFCKGTLQVNSEIEFVGNVQIACLNTIAPVPLLTAYGYQVALSEIDAAIASATYGGAIWQLWTNRRAIFLSYPKVDGFTIDYRWYASADFDSQNSRFRDLINVSTIPVFTLENVLIPAGTSSVKIGFFAKYGTAVGLFPATVSLYSNSTLLDSAETDLVPPGTTVQLLGITLPLQVASGGNISSTMVLRLPPQTNWDYYFSLRLGGNKIASVSYASQAIVNTLLGRGCFSPYLPLNALDNIYTIQGLGIAPSSRGVYSVSLKGESWKISLPATGCGINYWGLDAAARYDFGIVGYIEVV